MSGRILCTLMLVALTLVLTGAKRRRMSVDEREMISADDWVKTHQATATTPDKWVMILQHTSYPDAGLFETLNNWNASKHGFGEFKRGDYWLGLERIHSMTSSGTWQVMFKFRNAERAKGVFQVVYDNFRVDAEITEYALNVGNITHTMGRKEAVESLGDWIYEFPDPYFDPHTNETIYGTMFSTRDRENDMSNTDCASTKMVGWWWRSCEDLLPPNLKSAFFSESLMAIKRVS